MSKIFEFNKGQSGTLIDSVSKTVGTLTAGTGGFRKTEKGQAMLFDGTGYLDTNVSGINAVGANCYIEAYFKITKTGTNQYICMTQRSAGSTYMSLVISGVTLHGYYANDAAGVDIATLDSIDDLTAGIWYHVVMVRDNTNTLRLYLNSVLQSTAIDGGQSPADLNMFIGSVAGGTSKFNGNIAKLSTGLEVPTQTEINEMYKDFLNSYGTEEQKRNFTYPKPTDLSAEVDSVVGEQLVVNGGFDTDTWWTKEDGWEIDNGVASYDGNTNAASLSQVDATLSSPMKDDTKYKLSFTISNASTHARLYILDASGGVVYVSSTIYQNGKHIIEFTSPSTTVSTGGGISFYAYDSGSSFDIDDITVQEVTGLVAAYNMIPSKGKLIDISGQGNNGTITGALSTKDGMAFNGVDDYIDLGALDQDIILSDFSVAFRFNKNDNATDNDRFLDITTDANNSFQFMIDNAIGKYGVYLRRASSDTINQLSYGTMDLNRDTDIIYVVSGSTGTFYKNGVEIPTDGSVSIGIGGTGSYIGQRADANLSTFFDGEISDVKIYNRALSATEAQAYHNSFIKPTLRESFKNEGADGIVKTPKGWM